jgi:hypothetical protein
MSAFTLSSSAWTLLGVTPLNVINTNVEQVRVVQVVSEPVNEYDGAILLVSQVEGRDFTYPGMNVYAKSVRKKGYVEVTSIASDIPSGLGTAATRDVDVPGGVLSFDAVSQKPSRLPLAAPRKLRDKQDRWSIRDFGHPNCGLADNPAAVSETEAFRRALNSGEKIDVPKGRYPMRDNDPAGGVGTGMSAVAVISGAPVDVDFSQNATIIPGQEINGSRVLLSFQTDVVPSADPLSRMRLSGAVFDLSEVPASVSGMRCIDVIGYRKVTLRDILGSAPLAAPSGPNIGFGGGDTLISLTQATDILVDNVKGEGFGDTVIYISGNPGLTGRDNTADDIGERCILTNIAGRRCQNIIVTKRDFMQHEFSDIFGKECVNGISSGSTEGGPNDFGRHILASNLFLYKMQGRPIYFQGGRVVIANFIIQDFGLQISDQSVLGVATPSGMLFSGVIGSRLSNGYIGFREWAIPGGAATSLGPFGVAFGSNAEASPAEPSFDNEVSSVTFEKVYCSLRESAGSNRNNVRDAKEISVVAPSIIAGANSGVTLVGANTPITATYTPTLQGTTGDASAYDLRQGRYTKQGNVCTFEVYIDLNATTGLGGNVSVSLPFPAAVNPNIVSVNFTPVNDNVTHSATTYTEYVGLISGNTSTVGLYELGTGNPLQMTAARFGANARFVVSGTYITA